MGIDLEQNEFAKAFFPKITVPDGSLCFSIISDEKFCDKQFIGFNFPKRPPTSFSKGFPANEWEDSIKYLNRMRNGNEAVTFIRETIEELRAHRDGGAIKPFIDFGSILKPTLVEDKVVINSLDKEDTDKVTVAIEKAIYTLGNESGFYKLIAEINSKRDSDNKVKPKVVIGAGGYADRILYMANLNHANKRTFVTTQDVRAKDSVFIVFGIEGEFNYENVSPLNFGYTAWQEKEIVDRTHSPEYVLCRAAPVIAKIDIQHNLDGK